MVLKTTLTVEDTTRDDFNGLKATVAKTMSADEFLRVLMTVYRTQRLEVEEKSHR